MDLTQLVKELTDAKALVLSKDAQIATLTAEVTSLKELESKLAAVNAEIETLKAGDAPKLQEKLTLTEAALSEAVSVTRSEADRLCVASGSEKLPETATLADLRASIETNRTKLSATFSGGRSQEQSAGATGGDPRTSSFKTTRN
jgi:uncharacterized small protein (DUF1192 family)